MSDGEGSSKDETIFEGSDLDLGRFLVGRGLITAVQLQQVIRKKAALSAAGKTAHVGDLLVDEGFIKSEVYDQLRIQSQVVAACGACGKRFLVRHYNPATTYECRDCGGSLATQEMSDRTVIVPEKAAVESPSETPSSIPSRPLSSHSGGVTKPGDPRAARKVKLPEEVEAASKDPKKVFGKYILIKEIGRGGMAIVHKGWDSALAQYVALKFIKTAGMGGSEGETESNEIIDFEREARMSARLRHPNIVRIYELGVYDNKHYLAMDLLSGGSFFEVLHGGKQRNTDTLYNTAPEKFLAIMRDVLRAVHYAHTQNPPIIHRDLKPQNILMDLEGRPYVADFGLAKEISMDRAETVTGIVKGTPSYMAPEQAEGRSKETDPRTDVYSMGAIFYEILTGRPPFVGEGVRDILNQIFTKVPDRPNDAIAQELAKNPAGPHRPRPVPRELETICLKALEKKKADRYQTAEAFAADVERVLQKQEIEAREPGVVRKIMRKLRAHPLATAAVASLLLATGVGAGVFLVRPPPTESGIEQLLAAAADNLKSKDWAALRGAVGNLRKIDPNHPKIGDFEKEIAAHDAAIADRRRAWGALVKRITPQNFAAVLEEVRAAYLNLGELKVELRPALDSALGDLQDRAGEASRVVFGQGPSPLWLEKSSKKSATEIHDLVSRLLALAQDPDLPFRARSDMALEKQNLDRILAYRGTWNLRVNISPHARVTLWRGDKEVEAEFTPYAARALEVADGYRVELAWPWPEAKVKLSKDLKDLRHGETLTVSGDMTKKEIRVQK